MVTKLRNFIALRGSYLLLEFVATPEIRERTARALKTGLREQGLRDLVGTPARKRTIIDL